MKQQMRKILICFLAVAAVFGLAALLRPVNALKYHSLDAKTAVAGASLKLAAYFEAHGGEEEAVYAFVDALGKEEPSSEEEIVASEPDPEEDYDTLEDVKRKAAEEGRKKLAEDAARKASEEEEKKASEEAEQKAAEEAARRAAEDAARRAAEEAARQSATGGSGTGRQIADYAASFVGVLPYVWGGTSLTTGCDCSGFVATIYAKYGYLDQNLAKAHYYDSAGLRYVGKPVTYNASSLQELMKYLLPGDIICYEGHVAMYYGNGVVVHEPAEPRKAEFGSVMMKPIITIRRLVPASPVVTPTEPPKPSTEPETPSVEPTEPVEPATEPTEPATAPAEPATEPTEPVESAEPAEQS